MLTLDYQLISKIVIYGGIEIYSPILLIKKIGKIVPILLGAYYFLFVYSDMNKREKI